MTIISNIQSKPILIEITREISGKRDNMPNPLRRALLSGESGGMVLLSRGLSLSRLPGECAFTIVMTVYRWKQEIRGINMDHGAGY